MPYNVIHPLLDAVIQTFNATGGTPAGSVINIGSPWKGYVNEVGFWPNDSVTSAMTLQVQIGNNIIASNASNYTTIVNTTTFASGGLYQGNSCSVAVNPGQYVNAGDALRFITSGGNTSAVGCTVYAVIRRAV